MFQFPKERRLCNERVIDKLFANGESILEKPFRALWNFEENNDDVFVKVLIVVSKKNIKLATKRNIARRRIKEAYRLHKTHLDCFLETKNRQLNLALIYQEKEILEYKILEQKIKLLLGRLIHKL